jgi:hypothetical protein
MQFAHTYRALKRYGFSPFYCGRILLDAIRGDRFARTVVGIAVTAHRERRA